MSDTCIISFSLFLCPLFSLCPLSLSSCSLLCLCARSLSLRVLLCLFCSLCILSVSCRVSLLFLSLSVLLSAPVCLLSAPVCLLSRHVLILLSAVLSVSLSARFCLRRSPVMSLVSPCYLLLCPLSYPLSFLSCLCLSVVFSLLFSLLPLSRCLFLSSFLCLFPSCPLFPFILSYFRLSSLLPILCSLLLSLVSLFLLASTLSVPVFCCSSLLLYGLGNYFVY